jgi:hypothetical protein
MKKFMLLLSILFLVGCSESKDKYEEEVFRLFENEQDLVDYSIDPRSFSECVVDVSGKNMPGLFKFDPRRTEHYELYSDLVKFKTITTNYSSTFNKELHTMEELTPKDLWYKLKREFGQKGLSEAHKNFSESVLTCMESFVSRSGGPSFDLLGV